MIGRGYSTGRPELKLHIARGVSGRTGVSREEIRVWVLPRVRDLIAVAGRRADARFAARERSSRSWMANDGQRSGGAGRAQKGLRPREAGQVLQRGLNVESDAASYRDARAGRPDKIEWLPADRVRGTIWSGSQRGFLWSSRIAFQHIANASRLIGKHPAVVDVARIRC